MVRQWSWLGCVRPSLAGLQTWVIANSFLIQESSGPAKVPSTFPPLFWWLYCNCLFVFHARCLKHWCSSDHQTWHRNVPPSVLETHLFWSDRAQRSRSQCTKHCRHESLHSCECWLLLVRSTPPSRPNEVGLKCPYVRPSTKSFFNFNNIRYVGRDRWWRYAVWPDPRSKSRALESWKFGHLWRLSPASFIMGAGKWPRILKLGNNT